MPPKQPSMLPDLLQKVTRMPVSTAQDGQAVQPNHVYVIPPDKEINRYNGKIQLLDIVKKGVSHPIDFFYGSSPKIRDAMQQPLFYQVPGATAL